MRVGLKIEFILVTRRYDTLFGIHFPSRSPETRKTWWIGFESLRGLWALGLGLFNVQYWSFRNFDRGKKL